MSNDMLHSALQEQVRPVESEVATLEYCCDFFISLGQNDHFAQAVFPEETPLEISTESSIDNLPEILADITNLSKDIQKEIVSKVVIPLLATIHAGAQIDDIVEEVLDSAYEGTSVGKNMGRISVNLLKTQLYGLLGNCYGLPKKVIRRTHKQDTEMSRLRYKSGKK